MPMVVAFVDDLMDRSRISAQIDDVRFVRDVAAVEALVRDGNEVGVVVFDLARYERLVPAARDVVGSARFVGFVAHVELDAIDPETARADARRDVAVMARSRFFHDVRAALSYP